MGTLLAALAGPIIEAVSSLFPDTKAKDEAKAKLAQSLLELSAQQATQQTEINKIEAANQNIFVSGWRPFIGWTFGACIAWVMIGAPVVKSICGIYAPNYLVFMPEIPEDFWEIIVGMLGLGGMRSFEKRRGIQK